MPLLLCPLLTQCPCTHPMPMYSPNVNVWVRRPGNAWERLGTPGNEARMKPPMQYMLLEMKQLPGNRKQTIIISKKQQFPTGKNLTFTNVVNGTKTW